MSIFGYAELLSLNGKNISGTYASNDDASNHMSLEEDTSRKSHYASSESGVSAGSPNLTPAPALSVFSPSVSRLPSPLSIIKLEGQPKQCIEHTPGIRHSAAILPTRVTRDRSVERRDEMEVPDNDDDFQIIGMEDASARAQAIQISSQKRIKISQSGDDVVYVKTGPISVTPIPTVSRAQIQQKNDSAFCIKSEPCYQTPAQLSSPPFLGHSNTPAVPPPRAKLTKLQMQRLLLKRHQKRQNDLTDVTPARDSFIKCIIPTEATAKDHGIPIILEDFDARDEFMQAMNNHQDNDRWMENCDDHSDSEDHDMVNLQQLKVNLENRQKNGQLNAREEMELLRTTHRLEDRNRRNQKRHAEINAIFVSDNEESSRPEDIESDGARNLRFEQEQTAALELDLERALEGDFIHEENELLVSSNGKGHGSKEKGKGKGKSATPRRKPAKNAREFDANMREKQRVNQLRRKKKVRCRRKNVPDLPVKGKKGGKKGEGPKQHKRRMCNRFDNGNDSALQGIIEDLMLKNPVGDRVAQEDFGMAPSIRESTKRGQLEALIASIPDDYDVHKKKTDKSALKRASMRFGFKMVTAVNGKWMLKGMKNALYHHQLLAADWMVGRELSSQKPHGGLLADAMGLGKTLEILATMVGNPPTSADRERKVKCTLIVLPSSVIKQWMDEIRTHVDEGIFPKVIHFKRSKELPLSILQSCDIILTSYSEVMASYHYPSEEERKKWGNPEGYRNWLAKSKLLEGDLHRMEWYRVVLDEAHAIKNNTSRTSIACQNLNAKFRWALSGTPIQNRLEELFPYFRFLRAEWASHFDQFRKQYCDPDADDATARISVVLSIVMMRRTMRDRILGRPLVELPAVHPETKFISFSKEERVLYRILENRFRENLNRHFRQGTAQRNYGIFMLQLLRLRQCASHTFLLEQVIKDTFNVEDLLKLKRECSRLSHNPQPIYEQIKQWVQPTDEGRQKGVVRGDTLSDEYVPFGRSSFGSLFNMDVFLNSLKSDTLVERTVCRICNDVPDGACITPCQHIFCRLCIENYMHHFATCNDDDNIYHDCPACHSVFESVTSFRGLTGDEGAISDDTPSRKRVSNRKGSSTSGNGSDYMGNCPEVQSSWLDMCIGKKTPLLPSAKTIAVKAQILKWLNDAPNDKIIIFCQFRLMARILGLMSEGEGWEFVYLLGDMNEARRHQAVQAFHSTNLIKIMIAGLKCGGQALNLTCANRCISIDPWWNHCVEQQAFGRILRIGQHKETYVTRLVVRNSIDCRMLDMQADKVKMIDRAMQDTGKVVEPLDLEELAGLFGYLREGEDGVLEVVPDYVDVEEDDTE